MRLDHYFKIGDNNVHLAQIIYSILTILVLAAVLTFSLKKSLNKDFNSIELIDARKKAIKRER